MPPAPPSGSAIEKYLYVFADLTTDSPQIIKENLFVSCNVLNYRKMCPLIPPISWSAFG